MRCRRRNRIPQTVVRLQESFSFCGGASDVVAHTTIKIIQMITKATGSIAIATRVKTS